MFRICFLRAALIGGSAFLAAAQSITPAYLDLPPHDTNSSTSARSVNELGQISGNYAVNGGSRFFIWQAGTVRVDQPGNQVYAMNNTGQVTLYDPTSPVLWDGVGFVRLSNLALPPPYAGLAKAYSLNDQTQIAGCEVFGFDVVLSVSLEWQGQTPVSLRPRGSPGQHCAYAINNAGQIVGQLLDSGNGYFLDHGVTQVIRAGTNTIPYAINNSGQVVGTFEQFGNQHAFLWQNGLATDLHPPGNIWSQAVSIDGGGRVLLTSSNQGLLVWKNGAFTSLLNAFQIPAVPAGSYYHIAAVGSGAIVSGICPHRTNPDPTVFEACFWNVP